MKFLKVLAVIITICEGCRSAVRRDKSGETQKINSTLFLPIPYPKYLDLRDPAQAIVSWDPVKVSENNPILGFKIKLWEDEKKKIIKYVEKDGKQIEVEEWVPIKKSFHVLPKHKPALEAVVPPDVFSATFNVKVGEHYELRGQSYNADGDGPLSNTYGFRIHTDEEMKQYELTSTHPPIPIVDEVHYIVRNLTSGEDN